jgi:hypothetical protein
MFKWHMVACGQLSSDHHKREEAGRDLAVVLTVRRVTNSAIGARGVSDRYTKELERVIAAVADRGRELQRRSWEDWESRENGCMGRDAHGCGRDSEAGAGGRREGNEAHEGLVGTAAAEGAQSEAGVMQHSATGTAGAGAVEGPLPAAVSCTPIEVSKVQGKAVYPHHQHQWQT